ncbi:diguanylate cyclase [Sulfuriferula thiophila]|uniref:diguanylate cyclase n=1 Tax=Sulfuriferula thiophila TaxID=1781211 RepID=UPI000F606FFC|nr:diguanylate cyclase [Sulfuriferula thiophila]
MTKHIPNTIEERLYVLRTRWERYVAKGQFNQFIEFAVAVNSLAEYFNRLHLSGLVRLCEGLEIAVLAKLGDQASHPMAQQDILALQRQLDTLLSSVEHSRAPSMEQRTTEPRRDTTTAEADWIKPRTIWLVYAPEKREIANAISSQLRFFGFDIHELSWGAEPVSEDAVLAVLFIPASENTRPEELARIEAIRAGSPSSQLIYLGAQLAIDPIVTLMRAGVDVTIPDEGQCANVLNCILDLVKVNEQEKYRVLIVEDSRVAVALIQRTLAQHGMDTRAISDPGNLLEVLENYHPDLILMDMYMPRFNGVEATRVLRQMSAYSAVPIVYLSGESDVGMQVEALRLGGDQFIIKPFNPVLLAAIIKTKIERFRETQRSSRLDGLTGLLNHSAAKSRLNTMISQLPEQNMLTVAMIDIDHFKAVNDTYGHPVGDQVIRGLAWLLKGRLRSVDLIGRYGGEEFLIALPGISPEQATSVIDRIRGDFCTLPHSHSSGALYSSFSAGVAAFPMVETAAALTEAADGALLQAKRLGRNRVEQAAYS